MNPYQQFQTNCVSCGATTTKKYAREHGGMCKGCCEQGKRVPTRNERILEHGYQAYAREEGHYDIPDWA